MRSTKNFLININNFESDRTTLKFFFSQISETVKIIACIENEKLAFLNSKLVGPACRSFIESPRVAFKHEILPQFLSYFKISATIADFPKLKLLPQENIQSISHRLDILVKKIYPSTDNNSVTK